jgi:hypothetical protein
MDLNLISRVTIRMLFSSRLSCVRIQLTIHRALPGTVPCSCRPNIGLRRHGQASHNNYGHYSWCRSAGKYSKRGVSILEMFTAREKRFGRIIVNGSEVDAVAT